VIGSRVNIVPMLIISINVPVGTINSLLNTISQMVITCVLIFITMRIYGFKGNIAYEKKSAKEVLIPAILAILILYAIGILIFGIPFEPPFLLQAVIYLIFMLFGYHIGYRKREKDRQEMINNAIKK